MSEHVETYNDSHIQSIKMAGLERDLIVKDEQVKKMQSKFDKAKKANAELVKALREAEKEMKLWGDNSRRCDSLVRKVRAIADKYEVK